MVDGILLLVDASEGPLPQTRFVLRKALERRLTPAVIINKIDRPDARSQEVLNEVYDLFIDLDATEDQLDFPVIYCNARAGTSTMDLATPGTDRGRCHAIVEHIPPPAWHRRPPLQTDRTLDSSDISAASPSAASSTAASSWVSPVVVAKLDGATQQTKVTKLFAFDGLKRVDITEAAAGEIICLAGVENITIGETVTDPLNPMPIPPVASDEPTVSMVFGVNTSPMAGRDGQYVTSRQIRDRLDKELLGNVSIRCEDTGSPEEIKSSAAVSCSWRSSSR